MSGVYGLKPWFVRRLRSCEDILVAHGISPDTISFAAVAVSVIAGALIAVGASLDQPLVWLAVLPMGVIRLALNALDGSVARRIGRSSARGAMFNELGDRACDLALFVPLVAVAPAWVVLAGVAALTLTSTAGVMALAITGSRDTSGPMGKADRVVLLGLAAAVAAFTESHTPFVVGLGLVICGCVATTWLRVGRLPKEVLDVRQ